MTSKAEERLASMGLALPKPWEPRGNFLPYRRDGATVFLSGQICEWNGTVVLEGPVGGTVSAEAAHDAARVCALNLLYALKLACDGDLDRVEEVVRLGGFVNCISGFPGSPAVINGATDLFIAVFGDAGRHCRTAVGVAGLPGNAAVEVDAIVRIRI
jgi:enamine deaminase RidA (YjgF/YER057c/UK114 family)